MTGHAERIVTYVGAADRVFAVLDIVRDRGWEAQKSAVLDVCRALDAWTAWLASRPTCEWRHGDDDDILVLPRTSPAQTWAYYVGEVVMPEHLGVCGQPFSREPHAVHTIQIADDHAPVLTLRKAVPQ